MGLTAIPDGVCNERDYGASRESRFTMTTIQRNSAVVFAGLAFGRDDRDPMRVPEPSTGSSICGITSLFAPRGVLFEEDKGGGGGGGEKTFKQEDVDRIVQERVGKMKAQLDAATAALAGLDEIKAKLAEADAAREEATEQEKLKGKTELEKLQHQLQKATEKSKLAEGEWSKRVTEAEAKAVEAASKHQDYVKRSHIQTALSKAGLAKGADKAAVLAFLAEAQSELDENHEFKTVAVGGKSFNKLDDAAKQFLTDNPFFAAPQGGGSGGSRNPMSPKGSIPLEQHSSAESLIGAGLASRSAAQS